MKGETETPTRLTNMIINLFKLGNSNAIRIPKAILQSLNISPDEELDLETEDGKIVISKIYKKKNINELLNGYKGTYNFEETIDDAPVGKEIL